MAEAPQSLVLGAEFPAADRDAWLALVAKALKGADFDRKLVSRTADGLSIQPLYTRTDTLNEKVIGTPGAAPFTRGVDPARAETAWDIRQLHADEDPAAANAAILDDLTGGATSILLRLAAPGSFGLPYNGTALAAALDGVDLELCPVHLEAGEYVADAAGSLLALWRERGLAEPSRQGGFNADPLGTLARTGRLYHPLPRALDIAARFAVDTQSMAGVTAMLADGAIHNAAGATEGQELAAILSTLVAYLRAAEQAGLSPAQSLPKIAVSVAVDADQFLGIAKLRALRRLVWRIADAAGAGGSVGRMRFGAVSAERMMARRDPWVNMLRGTIACAAAVFGGAQAITVLPFTFALGRTDAFARRMARNIQIILQEESGLGRVVDPAGGSWYVERLTDDLARKAWHVFQAIEARADGPLKGMPAAIRTGWWQDEMARASDARSKNIATGRLPLIGVSAFPRLGDDGVTTEPWPQALPANDLNGERARVLPIRRLAAPYEALRNAADAHAAQTGAAPTVFLATLGTPNEFRARAIWIENFLAAGGITAVVGDGFTNSADAGAAFSASGSAIACLCSTDEIYGELGESTATLLKTIGASAIYLAGRPADRAPYQSAGVDAFIYAGCDAVAVLRDLHGRLGVLPLN